MNVGVIVMIAIVTVILVVCVCACLDLFAWCQCGVVGVVCRLSSGSWRLIVACVFGCALLVYVLFVYVFVCFCVLFSVVV